MTLVRNPTITNQINSDYFVEALGGGKPISTYLDRFPDTVYSKSIDSTLVIFLYALLGPTGVGQLRQEFLEARLRVEEAGLSTADLDTLYTNAFAFARLAEETYQLDADAALLPTAQRAQILAQDADFRNRAQYFLKGARAGGTLLGLTLAARSGLDRPVEVIENWRQLFDRYSDRPLNLPIYGQTRFTNEIVVVPRQVAPESSVQSLQITGNPVRGYFTLSYPPHQNWRSIVVNTTASSNVINVPDVSKFPAGVFVTVTSAPASSNASNPYLSTWSYARYYAVSGGPYLGSSNQIQLLNLSAPIPFTGSYWAFVGYGQTSILPYNANAAAIQNALTALPPIGTGNVICTGGPLPGYPVTVYFTNQLANQTVPTLQANLSPDIAVGINATAVGGTEQMSDINDSPFTIGLVPTVTEAGISIQNQITSIAPGDTHSMLTAMDQIRPWTSFITTQAGVGDMVEQEISGTFTGSTSVEVLRYVTGRAGVPWPTLDNTHWIQSGVEHEAPKPLGAQTHQYTGFHNIASCTSYTDSALTDPHYTDGNPSVPLSVSYWDTLVGHFSGDQLLLLPGLQNLLGVRQQFLPSGAPAAYPEPLIITNVGGQGVINDIYPADYLSLPGITRSNQQTLWASIERNGGTDYLEIDLGRTQAVNYISFQITSKPFNIDVAYDTLDQAPARNFISASIAPTTAGSSVTTVAYKSQVLWSTVTLYLTNVLESTLYTRFLRIGFTRQPHGTPYALPIPGSKLMQSVQTASLPLLTSKANYVAPPAPTQYTIVPYSCEVQNLRIGRNVNGT